ncbi:MAG: oxidoreductase [Myxococcales bacterium]|nr:oxidoreductase [Myxococcales bacterium]
MKKNFAMLGASGFVAPRHMKAISSLGHTLKAACDPYDGVGILDRYFPECRFFTEVERFDRYLERCRRQGNNEQINYLSICSPNYLHDAHCRLAMRSGAAAICEKPLVISPWNLDQLCALEEEHEQRIYTVLQLRLHESVKALKEKLTIQQAKHPHQRTQIELTYITRRGQWYHQSWKGNSNKSGTLAMNIGIHFFDMLLWLFGDIKSQRVHLREDNKVGGVLALANADVRWLLSIDANDLPAESIAKGNHAYRALKMGDESFDFSTGFDDLHTKVYADILAGGGYGIKDARPAIELVHQIRHLELSSLDEEAHPLIASH